MEQYLADKFSLSGPHALMSDNEYLGAPQSYATYGSIPLNGTVTQSTLLRFVPLIRQSPVSFGVPLYAVILDESTPGVVPLPTSCTTRELCGGRRFFSLCFNGGTNRVHCDETIDGESAPLRPVCPPCCALEQGCKGSLAVCVSMLAMHNAALPLPSPSSSSLFPR